MPSVVTLFQMCYYSEKLPVDNKPEDQNGRHEIEDEKAEERHRNVEEISEFRHAFGVFRGLEHGFHA